MLLSSIVLLGYIVNEVSVSMFFQVKIKGWMSVEWTYMFFTSVCNLLTTPSRLYRKNSNYQGWESKTGSRLSDPSKSWASRMIVLLMSCFSDVILMHLSCWKLAQEEVMAERKKRSYEWLNSKKDKDIYAACNRCWNIFLDDMDLNSRNSVDLTHESSLRE